MSPKWRARLPMIVLACAVLAALALSGCGVKNEPVPPSEAEPETVED
jgi:outer membrane lipoprotein-sorting protein